MLQDKRPDISTNTNSEVALGVPHNVVISASEYSLKAVFVWGPEWAANTWKKQNGHIANLKLVKDCLAQAKKLDRNLQVTISDGRKSNRGTKFADYLANQTVSLEQVA